MKIRVRFGMALYRLGLRIAGVTTVGTAALPATYGLYDPPPSPIALARQRIEAALPPNGAEVGVSEQRYFANDKIEFTLRGGGDASRGIPRTTAVSIVRTDELLSDPEGLADSLLAEWHAAYRAANATTNAGHEDV